MFDLFDLFSAHQIHFQLFFKVIERGKFPNANSAFHLYLYIFGLYICLSEL